MTSIYIQELPGVVAEHDADRRARAVFFDVNADFGTPAIAVGPGTLYQLAAGGCDAAWRRRGFRTLTFDCENVMIGSSFLDGPGSEFAGLSAPISVSFSVTVDPPDDAHFEDWIATPDDPSGIDPIYCFLQGPAGSGMNITGWNTAGNINTKAKATGRSLEWVMPKTWNPMDGAGPVATVSNFATISYLGPEAGGTGDYPRDAPVNLEVYVATYGMSSVPMKAFMGTTDKDFLQYGIAFVGIYFLAVTPDPGDLSPQYGHATGYGDGGYPIQNATLNAAYPGGPLLVGKSQLETIFQADSPDLYEFLRCELTTDCANSQQGFEQDAFTICNTSVAYPNGTNNGGNNNGAEQFLGATIALSDEVLWLKPGE